MWDRYDPRDDEARRRVGPWERQRGRRGGSSEHDRDRAKDGRDVFVRDLDLPLGRDRELVRDRDRVHGINGAESRVLATVGAFRVVSDRDLEHLRDGAPGDPVERLRDERLVGSTPIGPNERAVFLTERGRDLLEANRRDVDERPHEPRQAFYAGLRKPRELGHDTQVYLAYLRAEERLRSRGSRVRRVVLDYELKRAYQRFLQDRNRGRKDGNGRPAREPHEIQAWAHEHGLPYFDEQVHFPDLRIEYEDRDGCRRREDVEITTGHYRGARAAAAARSGFTRYRGVGGMAGGRGGRTRRGGTPRAHVAEDWL